MTEHGARRFVVLGGRRCPNKAALIAEVAAALNAPEWFGNNWDALAELIREHATSAPLTLEVRNPAAVAPDDPTVLATFADIVDELAREGVDVEFSAKPPPDAR